MPRKRKQQIKTNDIESLQGLMQEAYNDACSQIITAQGVINKLNNSTEPEDVDDATKITKATVDALKIKESAIKLKMEVAKLQSEIIKYKGDEEVAVKHRTEGKVGLDEFSNLRKFIDKNVEKGDN